LTHDAPRELGAAITVEYVPLPARDELEREWRALEERSDCSFFVSWSWIGCWLDALDGAADLRLLRARLNERCVGLGIFSAYQERRGGFIPSRTLRLHAVGRAEFDILTVECNGFLAERDLAEPIGRSMFMHLALQETDWDELVLDGLWHMPQWPLSSVKTRSHVNIHANHYVDLSAVRARGGNYLALLGSKTRSRIRRSCREYEKFGEICILSAGDLPEAMAFLDGLKVLHQQYWVGRGEPGAFSNRFFEHFHHLLVSSAFNRGEIQLLAIEAGSRRLGYIYNFVYGGRIYNYQSGFDYKLCEKHNRPGLVSHARAIELNALHGHGVYDFLGGNSEYKQSLGTGVGQLSRMVVQRNRRRFKIEAAARRLRDLLRRVRNGARNPPPHGAED